MYAAFRGTGSRGGGRAAIILSLWAVGLVLLALAGLGVQKHLQPTTLTVSGTESARGAQLMRRHFGDSKSVAILLRGPPAAIERQGPALVKVLEHGGQARALSPWDSGLHLDQLRPSPDTALVLADFRTSEAPGDAGGKVVDEAHAAIDEAISAPVSAQLTGSPVIAQGLQRASLAATEQAEVIALPILLLVLMLVFRSPVAAAIPLLFGGATVLASRGLTTLITSLVGIDAIAISVASMVGLALGVDYALLMVSRFREELRAGRDPEAALAVTVATAGRTILFAGCVLGASMLAPILLAPGSLLVSLATEVLLVVLVSVVNALVAGTALLGLLGRRVELGAFGRPAGARLGGTLSRALRRPLVAAACVLALVLLLAAPVMALDTGPPNVRQLPPGDPARQAFEAIQRTVGPGWSAPLSVILARPSGPITDQATLDRVAAWQRQLARAPGIDAVIGPTQLIQSGGGLESAGSQVSRSRRQLARGRRGLSRLGGGLTRAQSGVAELRGGLADASAGSKRLDAGAGAAAQGADRIRGGLAGAARGAAKGDAALRRFARSAGRLARGAGRASSGGGELTRGLATASGEVSEQLVPGADSLSSGLQSGAAELQRLRGPVQVTERGLRAALRSLQLTTVGRADPQYIQTRLAVTGALAAITGANPLTGAQIDPSYAGVDAGLAGAVDQLRASAAGASKLAAGARKLLDSLKRLQGGAERLSAAVERLAGGNRRLRAGAGRIRRAASGLDHGVARLGAGADHLRGGLEHLDAGASALGSSLASAHSRSAALQSGLADGGAQLAPFSRSLATQQRRLGQLERGSPGLFDSGYFFLAGLDGAPTAKRRQAEGTVDVAGGGSALRVLVVPTAASNTEASVETQDGLYRSSQSLGRRTHAQAALAGGAAELTDYDRATSARMPLIVIAATAITYLLLVLILRALLLPAIAVCLNLLTVAAGFGVLTVLFQILPGHPLGGPGYTDAVSAAGIFGLVFGLSIDYEVFLLGRMREGYLASGDTEAAVSYGLERTAGVIAGAAMIMVGVFLVFAASDVTDIRQFGIGLAVAVALDATLIRLVLLPALMRLCGDRIWWLPAALERRLPRLDPEGRSPSKTALDRTRFAAGRGPM